MGSIRYMGLTELWETRKSLAAQYIAEFGARYTNFLTVYCTPKGFVHGLEIDGSLVGKDWVKCPYPLDFPSDDLNDYVKALEKLGIITV